jgi:hypothetical protein
VAKSAPLVTKRTDPVGSFDARHAEALVGVFAPLIRQMIDGAVAAALQQYRDEQRSPLELEVFKLTEFCQRNNMGRSKFHQLKKTGLAPEYMRYGREYRITRAAEAEWRAKEHERAKSAEEQLKGERRKVLAHKANEGWKKRRKQIAR